MLSILENVQISMARNIEEWLARVGQNSMPQPVEYAPSISWEEEDAIRMQSESQRWPFEKGRKHNKHGDYRSDLGLKEPGFAEQLQLHTPFRRMEERTIDVESGSHKQRKDHKRKRLSSSTSYLEPNPLLEERENATPPVFLPHTSRKNHKSQHQPKAASEHEEIISTSSERSSISSRNSSSSSERYKRRARRKTRADRYELKEKKLKTRKDSKDERPKETKPRHSKKEKTSTALLHNFNAGNVASDRLTVSEISLYH
jgi:hypothetical protein